MSVTEKRHTKIFFFFTQWYEHGMSYKTTRHWHTKRSNWNNAKYKIQEMSSIEVVTRNKTEILLIHHLSVYIKILI